MNRASAPEGCSSALLARISHRSQKIVAPISRSAVLRAFGPSEAPPDLEFWVVARSVRNAGYSVFDPGVYRDQAAKWHFPQENATCDGLETLIFGCENALAILDGPFRSLLNRVNQPHQKIIEGRREVPIAYCLVSCPPYHIPQSPRASTQTASSRLLVACAATASPSRPVRFTTSA